MYKLQLRNQTNRYVMLTTGLVTLGRDPTNHFVISAPGVSDFHAEVVRQGDDITIVDLLSGSGTHVNHTLITGHHKLRSWDVISLGDVELEFFDPSIPRPLTWGLEVSDPLNKTFSIEPVTVIGRDPACTISFDNDLLSRRHAELSVQQQHLQISDLNSANGTYLNGRIITHAKAYDGDELRVGPYVFTVKGPAHQPNQVDATQIEAATSPTTRSLDLQAQTDDKTEMVESVRFVACLKAEDDSKLLMMNKAVTQLEEKPYQIGRHANNDIVIADKSVSKTHAQIMPLNGLWMIEDLGSSNGVKVNGKRIGKTNLTSQDVITLGRAVFQFELNTPAEDNTTPSRT
ncbi:MAG: pSer/pThr/pTyr-binding forkhead associated (FHA) protein [Limisphaerales bacterium]